MTFSKVITLDLSMQKILSSQSMRQGRHVRVLNKFRLLMSSID